VGAAALLKPTLFVLSIALAEMVLVVLTTFAVVRNPLAPYENDPLTTLLIGRPMSTIRLTSVFLVGVTFYLYRDEILSRLSARTAAVCGVLAALLICRNPHLAEACLVTFGGAALLWLALKAPL